VEAKHDLDKILNTLQISQNDCEIYIKNQNSWGKVLV
jgi:hypothetical protein